MRAGDRRGRLGSLAMTKKGHAKTGKEEDIAPLVIARRLAPFLSLRGGRRADEAISLMASIRVEGK